MSFVEVYEVAPVPPKINSVSRAFAGGMTSGVQLVEAPFTVLQFPVTLSQVNWAAMAGEPARRTALNARAAPRCRTRRAGSGIILGGGGGRHIMKASVTE